MTTRTRMRTKSSFGVVEVQMCNSRKHHMPTFMYEARNSSICHRTADESVRKVGTYMRDGGRKAVAAAVLSYSSGLTGICYVFGHCGPRTGTTTHTQV